MNISELENYNLADAVKFHTRLNPRIWDRREHMLPAVRERLLAAAEDFREFLGVQDLELQDITISGSNAAYTYTPHSDVDLHLVVSRPDDEVYRELFDAKKFQYNAEHDIRIGAYPVELYVQDVDQSSVSQGVYSLLTQQWIQVPQRRRVKINDSNVRDKYNNLQHKIEQAIASGSVEQMQAALTRLRQVRQAGLDQHGEFSAENLAFKMLRNQGVIDRLRDARNRARDQELSITERKKKQKKVRYGYGAFWYPGFAGSSDSGNNAVDFSGGDFGGAEESLTPDQQFDIIEEMIQDLAQQHGVDSDVIWEDFEAVDDDALWETAAWRRKAGKSKTGGLNARGVASYRRENPGSKLQTAVTTKPSKLKPGSKAAKRRKSFCARMSGVKGPMKKPNGDPTRKALALRKWNCHEGTEFAEGTPDGVGANTKMFVSEKNNWDSDVQAFVDFCVNHLQLQDPPHMILHSDPDWSTRHGTFGRYLPDQHELEISTHGRHIMDVFRTIAHELTHQRQHEVESVPNTAGHTGSRWENQANARAGVIMRDYADQHPELFDSRAIQESSGHIPTAAQASDPRWSMALTQDVRPGETGRQARRMSLKTDSQGHPALLIKNTRNQIK